MSCLFVSKAQGIIIPSGSYFVVNGGNIAIKNNWINNGNFTHNAGTILFAGAIQRIEGSRTSSFNRLSILTGSTTTMASSGVSVKLVLKCDGTLNAGNNLTLLANAKQTALIDGSGSGNVYGYLTMQGFLANSYGYKYLGSPFQSARVKEMSEEVNLFSTFPSVYRHDENLASNGWVTYTDSSNPLSPLKGYAFQLGNATTAKTIDMNGIVNNGNLSISLTNNNQLYTKGFQLISNPYPSPINWDATSGWTKNKIDNAIYFLDASSTDQYAGTYNSYVNGISSDGKANNILPAMQGFFVHVSAGGYPVTGSLGISNSTRINTINQPYRHLNGIEDVFLFRISASFSNSEESDPTVIYFQNNASASFDINFDALKLMNTLASVPSIYSIASSNELLSINALQKPINETRIPIGLQTLKDGYISIYLNEAPHVGASLFYYLHDSLTSKYYDLQNGEKFEDFLSSGICEKRFSLVFSRFGIKQMQIRQEPTSISSFLVSGTGYNTLLRLIIPNGQKSIIRIFNSIGQSIYTNTYQETGNYPLHLYLPKGIYHITCFTGNTVITRQFFSGE
jgi:hypothetical protein